MKTTEKPHPAKRGRKRVESYTPKDYHLHLFRLFMDGIYTNNFRLPLGETTYYYDKGLFKEPTDEGYYTWNVTDIFKDNPLGYMFYLGNGNEEGIDVSDYYFRKLDMKEIEKYLFKEEAETQMEKSASRFYKTLNEFVDPRKGYLVKSLIDGHKIYHPNESQRAFERFFNMLYNVTKGVIDERYSFLFKTRYFDICLDKQFVLDHISRYLWEKEQYYATVNPQIPVSIMEYDFPEDKMDKVTGTYIGYMIPLPFVGQYPRVYEDKNTGPEFAKFVRMATAYCLSQGRISSEDLEYHYFGLDKKYDETPVMVTDRIGERLKSIADKICHDLDYDFRIRERLDYILHHYADAIRNDVNDGLKTNVADVFNADPDGTYRIEDPWFKIVLSDKDREHLRNGSKITITARYEEPPDENVDVNKRVSKQVIDKCLNPRMEDFDELIEKYPEIVDSLVIPILSLIRFSPNALFDFLFCKDEWFKECTGEDETIHAIYKDGKMPHIFDVNKLVERLTRIALKDHLNDMSITCCNHPIRCIHAGNRIEGSQYFPSVLTFKLGESNEMALAWSEPIPKQHMSSKSPFIPYYDGIPCYSQRVLDIVKMAPSFGLPFRDFLVRSLVEHDSEWREIVRNGD